MANRRTDTHLKVWPIITTTLLIAAIAWAGIVTYKYSQVNKFDDAMLQQLQSCISTAQQNAATQSTQVSLDDEQSVYGLEQTAINACHAEYPVN